MLILDKWPKEGKVIKLNLVALAGTGVAAAPNPKAALAKGVTCAALCLRSSTEAGYWEQCSTMTIAVPLPDT